MAARPDFILGVDLDGVVGDHTYRFREILAELRGVDPETLPLERSWDFAEWGLGPDEYAYYHRIAVMEHDMFGTMPVIPGAAEVLWRLSDAGIWIRIITHRLYVHWGHGKAISDTAAWLDLHRIPYRDLCFLGAKPQVEADAYIDDAAHNIEGLRAAGNTVIVFDQPYNRHITEGPRAHTWADVETIVGDLAAVHVGRFEAQLPGIDAGSDRIERRRGASF
jgi:5'-nucleotidase